MKTLQKMTWTQFFRKMKSDWHFGRYDEQKAILAFEFAIVLSDVANQLKIEMTQELVLRGEDVLTNEMSNCSAEEFAGRMNGLALAVLEPKEV